MPQRCTVCTHPKRFDIDRQIAAASGSKRDIARQYGLEKDAVHRHAEHHLPRTLVKAQHIKEIAHADSLYAEVKALVKRGQAVLTWAQKQKTVGGGHLTLAAIRELRETFETLAKTAAELKTEKASEDLQDTQAIKDALNRKLDALAERVRRAHGVQTAVPPAAPVAPAGPKVH
jgi:hypothetical protein